MARPSSYNHATALSICARLADGESLRSICKDEDMPDRSTVFRWLESGEEFRDLYARAREAQAEALADDIVAISDGDSDDADPQRDKLRVDARKWVAAKLLPRKYGDAVNVKHTDGDGRPLDLADTGAAARLAALLEAVRLRAADTVEIAQEGSTPTQAIEHKP